MEKAQLTVWKRETRKKGPARKLRASGMIPAVLYGHHISAVAISLKPEDLQKAIHTKAGLNTLLNLSIDNDGKSESLMALLKDFQVHPVSRKLLHADLVAIDMTEKITVMVPVHLTGKPEGVKKGGILQPVLREMELHCLPNQIPESIDVEVTELEIGKSIHLADIALPEGVETRVEPTQTIAAVLAPKIEVEEKPEEVEGEEVIAVEGEAPAEGEKEEKAKEGEEKPKEEKKKE